MKKRDVTRLMREHGGWWEGLVARFPSVYQKEQFEKALTALPGRPADPTGGCAQGAAVQSTQLPQQAIARS